MNKHLLAVLVALAAAPAGAQTLAGGFGTLESAVAQARTDAAASAARRTLDETLVAMNDGPEAGGRVTAWLQENGVEVLLAKQSEAVKSGTVNGKKAILISDALPAHPRVYAPLIASEAARGIYADMPDCGERSYMIMATAARAFAELGGEFRALPAIDGDKVEAVSVLIAPWTKDIQTAVYDLANRDGVPTLPDLEAKASNPKAAQALRDQDGRFTAFLSDERDARREAVGR
jgi:hypothetical protein